MLSDLQADCKDKIAQALQHLRAELAKIRTGRAAPALVEDLTVAAYDGQYSLKELGSITAPEASQLLITLWDSAVVPAVEKALLQADLGVSPMVFDNQIRLNIPQLSEERREELKKKVGEKTEEAKIALRNIRHEKFKSLDEMEDEGKISEDEKRRARSELEEEFKKANEEVEKLKEVKAEELGEV